MIKRYVYLLLALCASLFSETQGWSQCCAPPMQCCDCNYDYFAVGPSRLTVRSELLYFQPTMDQSYYVISSTNNFFSGNFFPDGTRHNNTAPYKPGYRVEALYDLCNGVNEFDFRFTSFTGGHTSSVAGPVLFDTIGYPGDGAQSPEDTFNNGFSKTKGSFKYYAGDATFNRLFLDCFPENFTFLFGLHYAYIQFKQNFSSGGFFLDHEALLANSQHLTSESHFWGVGPQFGLDYRYNFEWCDAEVVSVFGNCRAALLCSNTKSNFHYDTLRTGSVGVNIRNEPLIRITPTIDARLGLSYNFCCLSYEANIELGYELVWYSNSIDSIVGLDVAFPGNTIDAFSSLNLQGPFLALSLRF